MTVKEKGKEARNMICFVVGNKGSSGVKFFVKNNVVYSRFQVGSDISEINLAVTVLACQYITQCVYALQD